MSVDCSAPLGSAGGLGLKKSRGDSQKLQCAVLDWIGSQGVAAVARPSQGFPHGSSCFQLLSGCLLPPAQLRQGGGAARMGRKPERIGPQTLPSSAAPPAFSQPASKSNIISQAEPPCHAPKCLDPACCCSQHCWWSRRNALQLRIQITTMQTYNTISICLASPLQRRWRPPVGTEAT
jgi:hypothetical protein